MVDLTTCNEFGAAVASPEWNRHAAWHARVTQQLQRSLSQAEANVRALDGGVQRLGTAVHAHRH